ncbi:MAG TPA: hypothetical protein VFG87_03585 [Amycolatopsis sp.]|jgi:hypothetical protein|nr:hypothetical protein [Amycolatopsis sp.]
MDHGTQAVMASAGPDVVALLVRVVLLLSTAMVAGAGLLLVHRRIPVTALGAVSAVLAVVSAFAFDVNAVAAGVHVVLVLAVPLLLARRLPTARWIALALLLLVVVETSLDRSGVDFAADTVCVAAAAAWFGLALAPEKPPRYQALTLALGLLLVGAGVVRLLLSGVAFDRRLYETLFGITLLAVVALPAAALAVRTRTAGAVLVAVGFLVWTTYGVLPYPPDLPEPGVPLLTTASLAGQEVPVLVSPQRPGRNLVHLPESAGAGITVGGVPASPRAGAEGYWADVDLPAGRSDLVLGRAGSRATIAVDAGSAPGRVISPECASAGLGGLIAGRKDVLTTCPEDALSVQDGDALRDLIGFLGARHAGTITLVSDSSPRGTAAAGLVRDAAASQGLRVTNEPGQAALVVVSGWSDAYTAMTSAGRAQRSSPAYPYGLYVAPWLLSGPIVNTVSASMVPLRFDPREESALTYAVSLGAAFGGENPTVGGFLSWLGPAGQASVSPVQLYASAQVNAMPMDPGQPQPPGMPMVGEGAGHWVPDGTVVPVSSPLD